MGGGGVCVREPLHNVIGDLSTKALHFEWDKLDVPETST